MHVAKPIYVKYRPGHDVYMWRGPADAPTTQMLFRPGWNDNRIRVDPGSHFPILNVDPDSWVARHGTRHSLWDFGFQWLADLFANQMSLVADGPEDTLLEVTDLGRRWIGGQPSRCYEADLDKDLEPRLYGRRVGLCVDERTNLPSQMQSWDVEDGEFRLVEECTFTSIRLDPGLTDADFDPDHYDL